MDIKNLLNQLTLEEKASLLAGRDYWHTRDIERLGLPALMMSDGPHGLRKQPFRDLSDHYAQRESNVAVCFPAASALACSFDPDLAYEMGRALGAECAAEEVAIILGPAMNIKRSPLCGRNFEYFSEDPYLTAAMAGAYIKGVQSQGVGTCAKHFAANSQETNRHTCSSEVDEETLRDIYLKAFEIVVKEAKPWALMCSYNPINGTHASENKWLLTDVLREEWSFDGIVMSDWGAVNDRVKGVNAGLDLEMPGDYSSENAADIAAAVKNGVITEETLDRSVARILNLVMKYQKRDLALDLEKDHKTAVKIAKRCAVLLKNEEKVLPLKEKDKGILYIGGFAETPRYQGGGSSHVKPYQVTSPLDMSDRYATVLYAKGFAADSENYDENLFQEAVAAAKSASTVVIFAGLPESAESEGYDREHMGLPEVQNKLIKEIASFHDQVAVVVTAGSPVEMPWADQVQSILVTYLLGEAVGEALSDLLFGKDSPKGRLAETWPKKLEDTPCYLNYPGKGQKAWYGEGKYVGHYYYEAKKIDVLFPFGFGLSYDGVIEGGQWLESVKKYQPVNEPFRLTKIDKNTTILELLSDPRTRTYAIEKLEAKPEERENYNPLRFFKMFHGMKKAELEQVINDLNALIKA